MVILSPTRIEMVNQVLPRFSVEPVKILIGKGPQQQLWVVLQIWTLAFLCVGFMVVYSHLHPDLEHYPVNIEAFSVSLSS